jgi:hypothetical protein
MFAIVEWGHENEVTDSPMFHNCLSHVEDESYVKGEFEFLNQDKEPGFEYELVYFDKGEPCPKCGRAYEF